MWERFFSHFFLHCFTSSALWLLWLTVSCLMIKVRWSPTGSHPPLFRLRSPLPSDLRRTKEPFCARSISKSRVFFGFLSPKKKVSVCGVRSKRRRMKVIKISSIPFSTDTQHFGVSVVLLLSSPWCAPHGVFIRYLMGSNWKKKVRWKSNSTQQSTATYI